MGKFTPYNSNLKGLFELKTAEYDYGDELLLLVKHQKGK